MESTEKFKDFDFKESLLPPEKQKELNNLRILQLEGTLTEKQRERFLELSREEKNPPVEKKTPLTEEEKEELKKLRIKQTESEHWTLDDKDRLLELQSRETRG